MLINTFTSSYNNTLPIVCVVGLTELIEEPFAAYMKAGSSFAYAPMKAYDLPRSTVWKRFAHTSYQRPLSTVSVAKKRNLS